MSEVTILVLRLFGLAITTYLIRGLGKVLGSTLLEAEFLKAGCAFVCLTFVLLVAQYIFIGITAIKLLLLVF